VPVKILVGHADPPAVTLITSTSLARIRAPKKPNAAPGRVADVRDVAGMFAWLKRHDAGSEIQWVWPKFDIHPAP
jgi:hypothetical protein